MAVRPEVAGSLGCSVVNQHVCTVLVLAAAVWVISALIGWL
jgi:hypothetical protein